MSARAPDCSHTSHHESTHRDRCPGNAGSPHRGYRSPKALPKSSCQLTGILIGTVCRSKPGHRHCGNRITGKSEQVARLRHHEQCQRGIQPPEIPTTICLLPVCSIRFFSPTACIIRISSQRFSLSAIPDGTNGAGSKYLSAPSHEYPDEMRSSHNHANPVSNDVILRRSALKRRKSNSV